ncbi:hypothetical protein Tco_0620199 [Tanacetum coccineum]
MVEEVTTLKKDFKQKENKYLEDFLDMKALKEKVEDKLFKQDQSLQTVHMLCKPKPYYDEKKKLYSEETLDIAKKTRIGMLEKMKSTLWVDSKIKITPPDYSKENYLATFTPQRQLTPEQIFWSSDLEEITPKPISKMTVYPPNTPKSVEIERKNLLIENENLIVDCLSTELLYSVMNVMNTVSRFSKMHDAYTVEQARIVKLEAGISRLKHKI